MHEFEAVVNGRDVIVMPDGDIDCISLYVFDAETEEEVVLSKEDECRLWQMAYEHAIDGYCV